MFAIQTQELTKRFPRTGRGRLLPSLSREEGTLAVDRVSLAVKRGEIFGLVGPNGAGKTTLVKMLCTLILPTSGAAWINGHPLADEASVKRSIGLVTGDERSFYWRLSCRDNLRFYAGLHNLTPAQAEVRIAELSALLGLGDFMDKRYDACSTGMRHRLALARGLLNDPTVLFLDEPTRSLDPLAAIRFREAVYALARQEGRTIFLVTHDLEEAEEVCDRVAVMLRGQLREVEDLARLRALIKERERCLVRVRGFTPEIGARLSDLEGVLGLTARQDTAGATVAEVVLQDRKRDLATVIQAIERDGGTVEGVEYGATSWAEVFREATRPGGEEVVAQPGGDGEAVVVAQIGGARPPEVSPAVALRGALRKVLLFLRRDLRVQMSYRLSFFLQFLGILFSSASFYFVALLFGTRAVPYLSSYGGDYFPFVLIGIAFVGYQGVAMGVFSGVVRSAQTTGTLEAMLVTPTRLVTILLSSSLWSFGFTSVRVLVYLLVGVVVFGVDLNSANVPAALVVLLVTVLALSGIGILSAAFIMVFKRGSPVNFLFNSLPPGSGVYRNYASGADVFQHQVAGPEIALNQKKVSGLYAAVYPVVNRFQDIED